MTTELTWKPIETAPKDGSVVLGYEAPDIVPMHWKNEDWQKGWHLKTVVWGDESSEVHPTHWMPQPDPPTA